MNTAHCRAVVVSLALCLLGSLSPLAAQQKPAPVRLEDPELYFAFLRAHSAVDQSIQNSSAAAGLQIASNTASLYHVSAGDLPKVTTEVQKFMANLAVWQAQEQAYVAQQRAAKKLPDMKILVNYQAQRQVMVMHAHASIHAAVTPSSWSGLYGYINGDFKTSLTKAAGAGK